MLVFDKFKIRDALTEENIFELLHEWGGDPVPAPFGYVSATICHNPPGEGSRKLYYYSNTGLFKCYTGCNAYFDIFELTTKVADIQWSQEFDLNDAVRWIAQRFGFSGEHEDGSEEDSLDDWKILANYERIQDISLKDNSLTLKEYDSDILERFNYNVKIGPWLREGISQAAIEDGRIGFYPGGDQITIPHFDVNDRFIGLRGRTLCAEEGERYGKYRPMRINGELYNHPLGMNLYNFNKSKKNIELMKTAIIFEGEKSTLLYKSYFGIENDISVACCGSSISTYQTQMLLDCGVNEIVVAFDRQFQGIGDQEFKHLKQNLTRFRDKYKNFVTVSFIFDKNMITDYKSSPIDHGPEIFLQLFKERIVL